MNRLFTRWLRLLSRWHHLSWERDLAHCIEHHERMLAGLPAEIRRLDLLRRYHKGRADTLASRRNVVNFRFMGAKR